MVPFLSCWAVIPLVKAIWMLAARHLHQSLELAVDEAAALAIKLSQA